MEKIILTKNEREIEKIYKIAEEGAKKLNSFIERSESVCKTNFTDEEHEKIRVEGDKFLKEWVKQKYPFKDADDNFNEKAIGIDAKGLVEEYFRVSPYWRNFVYEKDENGQYKLKGEPVQVQNCIKYAETKEQQKALELAESLCVLINEATSLGLIEKRYLRRIAESGFILKVELSTESMIPNKEIIARCV